MYTLNESTDWIDELKFDVRQLFRHGDRNILYGYKNDPWFDEKYWLEGFGQLTRIGKQQMFELGAYLRRRYYKLLPISGQYHVNDVYVRR